MNQLVNVDCRKDIQYLDNPMFVEKNYLTSQVVLSPSLKLDEHITH